MERLAKNTIWNSAGVLTYFACQWIITVIVVWLSEDFTNAGYLALAMNITNFFYTVAAYNIRVFQVSDIKEEYNDSEYVITRILTCVVSVLLCAALVLIIDFTATQRIIIICYMIFRANDAFIDVFHGIDQKNWRMDIIGVSLISRGVLMLTAFIILLWQFDLLPAIIGMAVITILVGLLYDIPKTKKLAIYAAITGKNILSLLKRCFPLMLVILISMVIVSFSRYSIERIYGTEDLGIYASVTAPTLIIQIATATLFAPLGNLFAECLKEGKKSRFVKIMIGSSLIVVGFTLSFVILSIFFGEWGLNILYGASIIPHAYLLPGAAVVAGLTAFVWLMNWAFTATRDIKGLFIGNLIGAVVCVATVDVLLIRNGLEGANYVMIISQSVTLLCLVIRLFWYINNKEGLFAGSKSEIIA